jgi:hypothetical protein
VTLSSSEAEYVGIATATQEVKVYSNYWKRSWVVNFQQLYMKITQEQYSWLWGQTHFYQSTFHKRPMESRSFRCTVCTIRIMKVTSTKNVTEKIRFQSTSSRWNSRWRLEEIDKWNSSA